MRTSDDTQSGSDAMVTVERTARAPWWRRRLFVLALAVGAVVGLAAGISWASTSDAGYESTGTSFVAFSFPPKQVDPFSGAQFVTQRIDTYVQLSQSLDVLQAVSVDVGALEPQDIADKITVSAVPGTVLLRVTAQDADPARAVRLATSMMTNLARAASAVEAGKSTTSSPIDLVTVQPPLTGPASSLVADGLAAVAGLLGGVFAGAAVGWILCLLKPGEKVRQTSPPSHGRHRGASDVLTRD